MIHKLAMRDIFLLFWISGWLAAEINVSLTLSLDPLEAVLQGVTFHARRFNDFTQAVPAVLPAECDFMLMSLS